MAYISLIVDIEKNNHVQLKFRENIAKYTAGKWWYNTRSTLSSKIFPRYNCCGDCQLWGQIRWLNHNDGIQGWLGAGISFTFDRCFAFLSMSCYIHVTWCCGEPFVEKKQKMSRAATMYHCAQWSVSHAFVQSLPQQQNYDPITIFFSGFN